MLGNRMPTPPRGMPMFRGPSMGANPFGRGFGGPPPMGQNAGGGNFLARLFQRQAGNMASGAPQAANMFSRGVGQTSFLQNLNPQSINGFLTNTQQVLNTARQIGPLVQQYGPIVRNLPAMWRLYKGFKDLPSDDSADFKDTNSKSEETKKEDPPKEKKETTKNTTVKASKTLDGQKKSVNQSTTKRKKGESVPKLYIP
ncbi:YqfQ family protein [Bacillus sp. IITD106]|nr:YqfQ family protein [Bacillus sp. IITD106]